MFGIRDSILRLLSGSTFVLIGVTMVTETAIEGGSTGTWLAFTAVFFVLNLVASYLHEGTEDMIEDIHDELTDD